jgi:hypothetical protein
MAQTSRAVVENIVALNRSNAAIKARLDDIQGRPLTPSEVRDLADIHQEFDGVFRDLDMGGADSPIERESGYTYRRRLTGDLIKVVDALQRRRAATAGRGLTEDERSFGKLAATDPYDWNANVVRSFAADAVERARAICNDPTQGDFRDPAKLRQIENVTPGGHRERRFAGDPLSWMARFMHTPQCVRSGLLVDAAVGRLRQVAPQRERIVYVQAPSPDMSGMITTAVKAALAAVTPGRRAKGGAK